LEYVYFQMKEHNRKFLSNFIKNINNAPLISKIDFPIFSGDFYLILKKIVIIKFIIKDIKKLIKKGMI